MSKRPLFTDFGTLRNVIATLGVNIDEQTRERLTQLWQGEEIEGKTSLITQGAGQGLYEILPNGTVIRVIVHAPQGPSRHRRFRTSEDRLLNEPEMWHRYHIFWCQTLDQWNHRLRKTNRNDGKFTYPVYTADGREHRADLRDGGRSLHLCKNCARIMPQTMRAENFDLERFFMEGPAITSFAGVDTVSDFDLIPNVYPDDWNLISKKFKEMRSWRCEDCLRDLSNPNHRRYLHAHHNDHRPHNCSIANLEALCVCCHAARHPANSRLQNSNDLKEFIRLFANESIA